MASEEYYKIVDAIRAEPAPEAATVAEMRANFDKLCRPFNARIGAAVEVVNANGVPAEWLVPPGASPDRVTFYLHGGGYVVGSPSTHRGLAARVARAASARVLSVDYRLAP